MDGGKGLDWIKLKRETFLQPARLLIIFRLFQDTESNRHAQFLRNNFFNTTLVDNGKIDSLLRGMSVQHMEMGNNIVSEEVRNFLFKKAGHAFGGDLVRGLMCGGSISTLSLSNHVILYMCTSPLPSFTHYACVDFSKHPARSRSWTWLIQLLPCQLRSQAIAWILLSSATHRDSDGDMVTQSRTIANIQWTFFFGGQGEALQGIHQSLRHRAVSRGIVWEPGPRGHNRSDLCLHYRRTIQEVKIWRQVRNWAEMIHNPTLATNALRPTFLSRYFYSHKNVHPIHRLCDDDFENIQKRTLRDIICENSNLKELQANPFLARDDNINNPFSCTQFNQFVPAGLRCAPSKRNVSIIGSST